MSDSDSDFAYESAGEDAELEQNVKNAKSALHESKVKSTVAKDVGCAETEGAPSSITATKCVQDPVEEVVKLADTLTLDKKPSSNTPDNSIQCLKNSELTSVDKTALINDTASENASPAVQGEEPKRVKLRLEKKLMEKNQAALQKNSPDVPVVESCAPKEKQSSWGWGSWGTSLLSSAATSVTTFTSQVSQGIGTVIETVESTLGAPPPEELVATLTKEENLDPSESLQKGTENEHSEEETDGNKGPGSSLFSGVTSLTKVIENTGAKVLMGGLDTLELIGKKTIDILTEGDPGLRRKRAALSEGMTLSQILRDARNKAEEKSSESDELQDAVLYTKFFDEFQGLVHLEALEMLSKQCQSKVESVQHAVSSDTDKRHILEEIRRICEDLPSPDDASEDENQDFGKVLSEHMEALHLPLSSTKLVQVQAAATELIHAYEQQKDENVNKDVAKEIYRQAISHLAEFTAKSVEHFHKTGELILVQPDMQTSVIECSTHLTWLTSVLSIETGSLSARFCDCLNAAADSEEDQDYVTDLITSVYLEASNSTTYIQDAFLLLIPVLQLVAVQ